MHTVNATNLQTVMLQPIMNIGLSVNLRELVLSINVECCFNISNYIEI